MIEVFIAGLAFGLLMGAILMHLHMETKLDEMGNHIARQDDLINLQNKFIKQNHWRMEMTIKEHEKKLRKECHVADRFEMETINGKLGVKIFEDSRNNKKFRVTYKNGVPIDISSLDPVKNKFYPCNNIKFGGF